jgi:predicted DNA-binding transcriptional regulator AlpA
MNQRFARLNDLVTTNGKQGRYPCSAATWWRWVARGDAPAPVKLGPNTTAWDLDRLDEWDAKKIAAAQKS